MKKYAKILIPILVIVVVIAILIGAYANGKSTHEKQINEEFGSGTLTSSEMNNITNYVQGK